MPICVHCPSGHSTNAPESLAGSTVRCGVCGQVVAVPATEQPAPSEAPPLVGDVMARTLQQGIAGKRGQSPFTGTREGSPLFPGVLPPNVYEADPDKVRMARVLAMILLTAALFGILPVLRLHHLNLETAPGWARAVLLMAAVQAVYVLWMASAPDWVSLWVVMLVFALASGVYALAAAVAMATPPDHPMMWGMTEVRYRAAPWCGVVLAIMSLASYLCARASTRWRRSFEREMAQRAKAAHPGSPPIVGRANP
jgi:hypothetical protein